MKHLWTKEEAKKAAEKRWQHEKACENYRKELYKKVLNQDVFYYRRSMFWEIENWLKLIFYSILTGILLGYLMIIFL